jgi:hypothetical protein
MKDPSFLLPHLVTRDCSPFCSSVFKLNKAVLLTIVQTPSSTSSSTYIPPTTSSDPPTTSPTPTSSPTPSEVYTSVTTVTGEVRTILVTPTPTASSDATLGQSATGGGSGVSAGKVVGIVLGSAVGVGAVIGAAVYVWFRRRQRRRQGTDGRPETSFIARTGDTSPSNNIPSRQVSQLSSSGLLGNKVPRINTAGMTNGSDPRSAEPGSAGFDRRSLATDQRLNPYALYIHDEGHVSNVSLQDNQDYSRQLRVRCCASLCENLTDSSSRSPIQIHEQLH